MSRFDSVRAAGSWTRALVALALVAAPITVAAAPALAEPAAVGSAAHGLPITPAAPIPSATPIWWRHGGGGWNHHGWQGNGGGMGSGSASASG